MKIVSFKIYKCLHDIRQATQRNIAVNEEYDPAADQWRALAPMPTARSGIAAAVSGGRVFIFGGESTTGTFNLNEAYDPGKNVWTTMSPMPTARHGLGAAAVGDTIYVLSGGPQPGATYSSVNEAFTPLMR